MKAGDTRPLRGQAADAGGLVDLSSAQSLVVSLVSEAAENDSGAAVTISGAATALQPPVLSEDGYYQWNWEYAWQANETSTPGNYEIELVVTDALGVVTTFPSKGTEELVIEPRVA
jgi:hypothetical protein